MKLQRFCLSLLFSAVLALFIPCLAFAQDSADAVPVLENLAPVDAIPASFGAYTTGMRNFFGNPAAYFQGANKAALVFYNTWLYCGVFDSGLASFAGLNEENAAETVNGLVAGSGFGGGFSAGFGWIGKNVGLGIVSLMDMYGSGTDIDHTSGTFNGQLLAILGYSVPVLETDALTLRIGGDVRPFIRFTGAVDGEDLGAYASLLAGGSSEAFMGIPVYAGASAELNAGLLFEAGTSFKAGVTVRYLAPSQLYSSTTVGLLLESFGFAGGGGSSLSYTVLPDVGIGLELHPLALFEKKTSTDITVLSEIQDLVRVFDGSLALYSAFSAGLKFAFLDDSLRCYTGFSGGSFSFGCGFTAWFMSVDVSVFAGSGGTNRQGISLSAALHF